MLFIQGKCDLFCRNKRKKMASHFSGWLNEHTVLCKGIKVIEKEVLCCVVLVLCCAVLALCYCTGASTSVPGEFDTPAH